MSTSGTSVERNYKEVSNPSSMSNIGPNKEYKLKDTAIAAKKKQIQLEVLQQLDANHQSHQTYGSKKKILEEEVSRICKFRP